ncbi:MAG: crossover junction endodeoxyribonuclease RuvC [Vicinamibacterales bacterium]
MRVLGIDPGSVRTGYGCIESVGGRHRLVASGTIATRATASFPDRLVTIHRALAEVMASTRPDCVAVETLFHAANARSALVLGHARGVALLAARQASLAIVEYSPAEVKRAVVGYGRAEKAQVQHMVTRLLGLKVMPSPFDTSDALAVAICHLHSQLPGGVPAAPPGPRRTRSWRTVHAEDLPHTRRAVR